MVWQTRSFKSSTIHRWLGTRSSACARRRRDSVAKASRLAGRSGGVHVEIEAAADAAVLGAVPAEAVVMATGAVTGRKEAVTVLVIEEMTVVATDMAKVVIAEVTEEVTDMAIEEGTEAAVTDMAIEEGTEAALTEVVTDMAIVSPTTEDMVDMATGMEAGVGRGMMVGQEAP